jgi:Arylsulfotransferase (ASST)
MNSFESSSPQSSSDRRNRLSGRVARAAAVTAGVALLGGSMVATASAIVSSAGAKGPGAYTTKGAWKFLSAPRLHPPILKVNTHHSGLANGYFLVANLPEGGLGGPMTGEGGPILYDQNLRPVWVHGVGTKVGSANLERETYQPTPSSPAEPVLVWWEGDVQPTGAVTKGEWFVVDEHYHQVGTLKARSPWITSLHDAVIVGPNIWVTSYRHVKGKYKKWQGTVYDAGIQEYNLKTGKLVYQWDALKGPGQTIPLSESKQPTPRKGGLWDAYHLNSLQVLPNGNLLFSLRNTWAVYLFNPKTKKFLWTLGGNRSSFKSIAKNARFAWQHDARLISGTGTGKSEKLSLFNDNCTYIPPRVTCQGPSEGMVLNLNTPGGKATLVKGYQHQPGFKAQFLGSMQVLPNGNALVGWGSPYSNFTEFSRSGKALLDVSWPHKDQSYRVKFAPASGSGAWIGTPYYAPSGVAKTTKGKTTVYASWNGATEVAKWQVFAGSSASSLAPVATHSRSGFETKITLSKSYSAYQVQALDSGGHVLATSKTFS